MEVNSNQLNISDYWKLSEQQQNLLLDKLHDFLISDIFSVILQREKANQMFQATIATFFEKLLDSESIPLGPSFTICKTNGLTQLHAYFGGKSMVLTSSASHVLSEGLTQYLLGEKDATLVDLVFKDFDEHCGPCPRLVPHFEAFRKMIQFQIEKSFPHVVSDDDFPDETQAKRIESPENFSSIIDELTQNYQIPTETTNIFNDLPTFQIFQEDSVYRGFWKNGERDHLGIGIFGDGEWWYFGHWKSHLPSGDGCIVCKDSSRYEGGFHQGLPEGHGKYIGADNTSYEGAWHAGNPHGKGRLIMSDGSEYIGEFQDGRIHGQGLYKWTEGEIYDGQFKDCKFSGPGTLLWSDGKKYEGEWQQGMIHGFGELALEDGSLYSGEFGFNKKNGKGRMKLANGKLYEGTWKNGLQNGIFWVKEAKGEKREGVWQRGVFQKWAKKERAEFEILS